MVTLLDTRNLSFHSAPRYFEGLHDESARMVPDTMVHKKVLVWQFDRSKILHFIGMDTVIPAKIVIGGEASDL
jgi:hypothetical protein